MLMIMMMIMMRRKKPETFAQKNTGLRRPGPYLGVYFWKGDESIPVLD